MPKRKGEGDSELKKRGEEGRKSSISPVYFIYFGYHGRELESGAYWGSDGRVNLLVVATR
jgi:hypothetical protein